MLHPAEAGHPPRRWTFPRWRVVAVAAAILVGGLLVTPAFVIGSRLRDLVQGAPRPPDVVSATWSPAGRRVAFLNSGDLYYDISVMNADGNGQRRLARAVSALWPGRPTGGRSPSSASTDPATSEIYVINADGSGQRNLTRNLAAGSGLAWSPDGRKIAFGSERDGHPEIYIMNADGSGQRALTRKPAAGSFLPGRPTDGRSPS